MTRASLCIPCNCWFLSFLSDQVKQLQGSGVPTDSHVVRGIVLRKNVANRGMCSRVDHPRIIMLGGALQYQGVADTLASFEALQQQVRRWG